MSPFVTAQCNAVIPSPCASFASAPCSRRSTSWSRSPRIAASATSEVGAARATPPTLKIASAAATVRANLFLVTNIRPPIQSSALRHDGLLRCLLRLLHLERRALHDPEHERREL